MNAKDRLTKPEGVLRLNVYRKGVLVGHYVEKNTIVNGHKAIQASLLGGDVTDNSITTIGIGTNGTAATPEDTALTNSFTKAMASHSYPVAGSVQFDFSIGDDEANGLSIREFGLLCADGTLFSRKVRGDTIVKTDEVSLSGTWTLNF